MVAFTPVYSSHVDAIAHDGANLLVRWDNGKVSCYKGVPAALADEVAKSWSVGKALGEMVKGRFEHSYVSTEGT